MPWNPFSAVKIPPGIRDLRRLLYCGEWIESHVLHMYMLQGPDFLGFASGLEMARSQPELVKRGLRMKKAGNQLLSLLGGRSVHPVSVKIGGFSQVPNKECPAYTERRIPVGQRCRRGNAPVGERV